MPNIKTAFSLFTAEKSNNTKDTDYNKVPENSHWIRHIIARCFIVHRNKHDQINEEVHNAKGYISFENKSLFKCLTFEAAVAYFRIGIT